ncbi:MAG: hypothetical protein IT478_15510, partial [Xanthomonadales bacterium]|nr:hypothetical protein [Xanthomonadales bacterium]
MHPIHIQQAPDTSELGLRFPDTRCVNCGTHQGRSEGVLELRQTTYLLVAGTELLLRFPVVSCERCDRRWRGERCRCRSVCSSARSASRP